jgi:hypothetical protein
MDLQRTILAVLCLIAGYDLHHRMSFAFTDKLLINHPDITPELLKGGVYE